MIKTKYSVAVILLAAAVMAAGCHKEELDAEGGRTLKARVEGTDTKTSFDGVSGNFRWNEGDEIAVRYSDGTYKTAAVNPTDGAVADVSTSSTVREYYAVYPASIADASNYGNPTLKVNLPSSYDIRDIISGSSATRTADFSPLPMVAVNDENSSVLDFYHVGGLLRICPDVPAGTRSITVTLDKGITGSFAVNVADSKAPTISAAEATGSNTTVTYIVSESGLTAETSITLNVPLPCGTYSHVNVKALANSTTVLQEKDYDVSLEFARHHGKHIYTYTFEVTAPLLIGASETQSQFNIRSYRTGDGIGNKQPVNWEIVGYSEDLGQTYSMSGRPAWLTGIVSAGAPSQANATQENSYSISVDANETPIRWDGETEEVILRDLSCYDIYGNIYPGATEGVPYNTANCYVVSAPGTYIFPIVYGNAIKNGADNTDAYRKNQSDATNLMGAFKNHLGNAITSPWIQDNVSLPTEQYYDAAGKGQLFEVLWESVDGLIARRSNQQKISQGIFDGKYYAAFTINPDKITQGNAVIAVKDTYGKIAWCWHIWVIPAKKLASKTVYSHPTTNVSTVNPQEMLAMNLGFCEGSVPQRNVIVRFAQAESGKTVDVPLVQEGSNDSYSPAYQWGRKDPIYPYVNGTMRTVYDGSGSTITSLTTSAASTVQNSIQNPATYYLSNGNKGNWCITRYDNLWNSHFTTVDKDENVCKTIYDPCPPGFKVPNRNAFSGFLKNGKDALQSFNLMFKNSSSTAFYLDPENYSKGGISFYHNYMLETDNSGNNVTSSPPGVYLQTATPNIDGNYENNWFFLYYPAGPQAYSALGERRSLAIPVRPVKE